jgi:hypothetical protein
MPFFIYICPMTETDTSHFYLDGSPKRMDFMSREKPGQINWPDFNIKYHENQVWPEETPVVVLRASLFFHSEQKITLGKLREFFTPKAIELLEMDGYIKIEK